MVTLPAYIPSDRVRRVREDFLAHSLAQGGPAVYRVAGAGDGVLLTGVVVTVAPIQRMGTPGRSAVGARTVLEGAQAVVEVGAAFATESATDGVADAGDGRLVVRRLKSGDTLDVHGGVVNRPDVGAIRLRVGDRVDLVDSAYWSAQCVIAGEAP